MSLLLVIGAGGHARVLAEAVIESGIYTDIAFLDDRYPKILELDGYRVVGKIESLVDCACLSRRVAVAIGDNLRRVELIQRAHDQGFECPSIVHPSAVVSTRAVIGPGTLVLAQCVVAIGSVLGIGCIVNNGSTIDHDCRLGDGVHVAPGAHLAGGVTVGRFSWIGIGATINQSLTLGENVVVGASAAVTSDISNNMTCAGVPARPMFGDRAKSSIR